MPSSHRPFDAAGIGLRDALALHAPEELEAGLVIIGIVDRALVVLVVIRHDHRGDAGLSKALHFLGVPALGFRDDLVDGRRLKEREDAGGPSLGIVGIDALPDLRMRPEHRGLAEYEALRHRLDSARPPEGS